MGRKASFAVTGSVPLVIVVFVDVDSLFYVVVVYFLILAKF